MDEHGTDSARPRVREVGVAIGELPTGPRNAITDVAGVRVGQVSLIAGEGPLRPGVGPVRTGVTAIWPGDGNPFELKVPAATFVFNGFGKTIGLAQVAELGVIETPILLTNTLNVPRVADALVGYLIERNPDLTSVNPIVGECNDSFLNDIRGRHVHAEHVVAALESATGGPVDEGVVGAGVGMSCYGFKGGIGTASRLAAHGGERFTVGALVLSNFGRRGDLRIDGVPVGREIDDEDRGGEKAKGGKGERDGRTEAGRTGSIMMVVGTDAPLDARQCGRLARRAALGMARTGSSGGHGSGDFVIAFANGNRVPHRPTATVSTIRSLAEDGAAITLLFQAVVESVEEAILNSLFRARTVVGRDGNRRDALPIERVLEIMRRHGRK